MKNTFSILILIFCALTNFTSADEKDGTTLSEAEKELIKSAYAGDPDAQFQLGMHFLEKGEKDAFPNAFSLFKKAANQGHAKAQYALGLFYDTGSGVAKDEEKARHWYSLAAKQGITKAQIKLDHLPSPTEKKTRQDSKPSTNGKDDPMEVELNIRQGPKPMADSGYDSEEVMLAVFNRQTDNDKKTSFQNKELCFSVSVPKNWHDSKRLLSHAFAPKTVKLKPGPLDTFKLDYDRPFQLLVISNSGQIKWPTLKVCEYYISGAKLYNDSYQASVPKPVFLSHVTQKCAYFTEVLSTNQTAAKGLTICVPHEDGYYLMLQFRADPESYESNLKKWWEIAHSLHIFKADELEKNLLAESEAGNDVPGYPESKRSVNVTAICIWAFVICFGGFVIYGLLPVIHNKESDKPQKRTEDTALKNNKTSSIPTTDLYAEELSRQYVSEALAVSKEICPSIARAVEMTTDGEIEFLINEDSYFEICLAILGASFAILKSNSELMNPSKALNIERACKSIIEKDCDLPAELKSEFYNILDEYQDAYRKAVALKKNPFGDIGGIMLVRCLGTEAVGLCSPGTGSLNPFTHTLISDVMMMAITNTMTFWKSSQL